MWGTYRQFITASPLTAVICIGPQWRGRLHLECDSTYTETRFRLSAKQTSPFKSAGASVQLTTGSRRVHISCSKCWIYHVLRLCEGYWLPIPFTCFPFTSPPMHHHVSSRFNRTLLPQGDNKHIHFPKYSGLSVKCYRTKSKPQAILHILILSITPCFSLLMKHFYKNW